MKIKVCKGKSCENRFGGYILTRLLNDKERFNLKNLIIEETPCMGLCEKGPNISIDGEIKNYMTPVKASELALNFNNKKK